MKIVKATKKPVTIEAVQLTKTNVEQVVDWIEENGETARDHIDGVLIDTFEGSMLGRPGSWIIKGVGGEFYPCDPAIFDGTYNYREVQR